jgi:hypothetical protein
MDESGERIAVNAERIPVSLALQVSISLARMHSEFRSPRRFMDDVIIEASPHLLGKIDRVRLGGRRIVEEGGRQSGPAIR